MTSWITTLHGWKWFSKLGLRASTDTSVTIRWQFERENLALTGGRDKVTFGRCRWVIGVEARASWISPSTSRCAGERESGREGEGEVGNAEKMRMVCLHRGGAFDHRQNQPAGSNRTLAFGGMWLLLLLLVLMLLKCLDGVVNFLHKCRNVVKSFYLEQKDILLNN